jgi:hypothetical protein
MIAMGLNTEEEGSPMAFFRRGYRVWHACSQVWHCKSVGCRQCVQMRELLRIYGHACCTDLYMVGGCLLRGGVSRLEAIKASVDSRSRHFGDAAVGRELRGAMSVSRACYTPCVDAQRTVNASKSSKSCYRQQCNPECPWSKTGSHKQWQTDKCSSQP